MFTYGKAITFLGIILELAGIYWAYIKYPSFRERRDRQLKQQMYAATFSESVYEKERQEFTYQFSLFVGGLLFQLIGLIIP